MTIIVVNIEVADPKTDTHDLIDQQTVVQDAAREIGGRILDIVSIEKYRFRQMTLDIPSSDINDFERMLRPRRMPGFTVGMAHMPEPVIHISNLPLSKFPRPSVT